MVTDAEIGERLKAARKARKLSREQVAQRIGKSVATIQHNENGTRSITIDTLTDYCKTLRISTDWLIAGIGQMSSPGTGDPDVAEVINIMSSDKALKNEIGAFARFRAAQSKVAG
jgi:transcriptional regulator with XRE-family HTH domain